MFNCQAHGSFRNRPFFELLHFKAEWGLGPSSDARVRGDEK